MEWMYAQEIARRRAEEEAKALADAALARQRALEQAAEQASQVAIAEADPQQKVKLKLLFDTAQADLVGQAQLALKTKYFSLSVNLFKGATDFAPPSNDVIQQLAEAQIEAEKAEAIRANAFAAAREKSRERDRQEQLQKAQKQIAVERARMKETMDAARRDQQEL